jgi:hypothetical protein
VAIADLRRQQGSRDRAAQLFGNIEKVDAQSSWGSRSANSP